eukprot:NODE_146_length_2627_cov_142.149728_g119_i0.p1 GENE.NODE_146_length_2627_cov_142.149728_g119_i0~~NODE_146_length_2627_cov_142.149728_g119_i0.p1  ORF type:complete len:826 (-),score=366.09 NODE_146_length_2627_cov_142.149728_g119_i0:149-2587(-)
MSAIDNNAFFGAQRGGANAFSNQGEEEDEIYKDFKSDAVAPAPGPQASAGGPLSMAGGAAKPMSSWGGAQGQPQGSMMPPGTSMGGAGGGDNRPMTSIQAAGYRKNFDPLKDALGGKTAPPLEKKSDKSHEERCLEMERKIDRLIEESAGFSLRGDPMALEKAKEAHKKERALNKYRDEIGLADQVNIDLTYSVLFNLAVQSQLNQLYTDALNTYSLIVRNKNYAQSGRLRVNMGNIYYEWKKYPLAIKMYRMALDSIPNTGKEVRFKIMRNIGNAFVKMGQYQEAMNSYEAIMDGNADIQSAFNLLLCIFAVGDGDRMKRHFVRMLNIRVPGADEEETDLDDPDFNLTGADQQEVLRQKELLANDALRQYMREKRQQHNDYLLTGARLIAPLIEKDWTIGFDYIIEQLRHFEQKHSSTSKLAAEMEMCKAMEFLRHSQFSKAIDALKAFEKKDRFLRARAATNLSYLYFLEGDHENGEKYANMAVEVDKYNPKSLVNRGNFHYAKEEFDQAKSHYIQALAVENDSVEAQYNLGLANKATGNYQEALHCFKKLRNLVPDAVEVSYQIAHLYELLGDNEYACEWFTRVKTMVPTDPGIYVRLGYIQSLEENTTDAFGYYLDAYRLQPVNLDVISWLGSYFIKMEAYEKAMKFFERAAQIQPGDVKWQLMVANCHRRVGQYPQAKRLYEEIARRHPENLDCLSYLVTICNDTGYKEEALEWHKRLQKVKERLHGGPDVLDQVEEKEEGADLSDLAQLLGTDDKKDGEDAAALAAKKETAADKRQAKKEAAMKKDIAKKKDEDDDDLDLDDMLPS